MNDFDKNSNDNFDDDFNNEFNHEFDNRFDDGDFEKDFDNEFEGDFGHVFSQGLRMMIDEEFEEALRLFDETIEQEPIFAEAYAHRGNAKYYLGRVDEAREDAEAALNINPDCVEALALNGRISIDTRKYTTALNALSRAVELEPDSVYNRSLLGRLYLDIGSYPEAIVEFSEILRLKEGERFALLNRAWGYSYVGQFDEAFEDNDLLIKNHLQDNDVLFQRGVFCFTMKHYQDALFYHQKALENHVGHPFRFYIYIAWSFLLLNRFEDALKTFEKCGDFNDKSLVRNLFGHAVALGRLGRWEESQEKLQKTLELSRKFHLSEYEHFLSETLDSFNAEKAVKLPLLNDSFARMMNLKAIRKIEAEQYGEALEMLNQAVEADPLFEWSYDNRAKIHFIREEYESVLENVETMLRLSDDMENRYKKGLALARLERFDEAFEIYTGILEENIDANVLCERSKIYRVRGEMDKAIDDITRAIDIGEEEDLDRYLQARAHCYSILELYDKALDDFARILYFQPDHLGALHNRAILYYLNLNRYEEAIRDETYVIQKNSDVPGAYTIRGSSWGRLALEIEDAQPLDRPVAWPEIAEMLQSKETYDAQECWNLAFDDLKKAIEINPKDVEAFWERGYFQYKNENRDEARQSFQTVLKISPDNPGALYWYANICCDMGFNEEAIKTIDFALGLHPETEGLHNVKGQALRQLFRFEEAEKEFELVLEKEPEQYYIAICLADVKNILGLYDEALALADFVLAKYPEHPYAFFTKVETLISWGRMDEAVQLLRQSTEEIPNQARAFSMLGEIYEIRNETDLADECYEMAIQSTPSDWDPDSINMLYCGIALAALGEHELAIPCFINSLSELEERAPYNESDYWLAKSYFALERYEEAKEHADRAIQYVSVCRDWESRVQTCRQILDDLNRILSEKTP